MVIGNAEVMLGVDTHRDVHTAAVVTMAGVLAGCQEFPATEAGYQALLVWARDHGLIKRAGVECTGSYGASLSRLLQHVGIQVFDVNQPDKRARRTCGKTDAVDAEAAARAVLTGRADVVAKTAQGPVEAIRALKMVRDSAVQARTKAINQLKSLLVTASPSIRESFTGLGAKALIRRCAQLSPDAHNTATDEATVYALRSLAERILSLSRDADHIESRIAVLVAQAAPAILDRPGVGPDTAAALIIVAGDNSDRITRESSFAARCGVSPVEASSGKTQRRRLNRGGDRRANAALYRIVISRLRWDARTQAYMQRRLAEGRTRREVIRCLKRYVCRELFTLISPTPDTA